jgi:putative addiction module component (TIGR02574 family)
LFRPQLDRKLLVWSRSEPDFDPLTDEQKRMPEERLDDYEANPDEGSTWEEVEARILKSHM